MIVTLAALTLSVAVALAQESIIVGGEGDDTLVGTALGDSMYGRGGNDILAGFGGQDELDGGAGGDAISGGSEVDSVAYSGAAVTVTLNGLPDDGAPGEGDNIGIDVEDIYGTDADDKLVGSAAENTLDGNGGNDSINGGPGQDGLYGGEGDDRIDARDGSADRIECGPGDDVAIVDARDSIANDCETIVREPVTERFTLARVLPGGGTRVRRIQLLNVANGSRLTIACVSGCRPRSSRRRALLSRRSVASRKGKAQIALKRSPRLVVGSTFEIGIKAPRSRARCVRYRLSGRGGRILRLRVLTSHCTSVARNG